MSLERRRATAADAPSLGSNPRRAHLEALGNKVNQHPHLGAGVVERLGVPVLSVTCVGVVGARGLAQEIGCDLAEGAWRFVWADDGTWVTAEPDMDSTVAEIAYELGAST